MNDRVALPPTLPTELVAWTCQVPKGSRLFIRKLYVATPWAAVTTVALFTALFGLPMRKLTDVLLAGEPLTFTVVVIVTYCLRL